MNGDLFEQLLQGFEDERQRSRANHKEFAAQQTMAKPDSLTLVPQVPKDTPAVRLPAVKPYAESRQARKEAEAEQRAQWRLVQTTQRTALAVSSMVAVSVHAQRQLNMGAGAMEACLWGEKRTEVMNQFVAQVTAECLARMDAGVMSVIETHPKRLAENL